MHQKLVESYIATIRQRVSEGDCPVTPAVSGENMEGMILTLADALAQARAQAMEEAARVADTFGESFAAQSIAEAIRALAPPAVAEKGDDSKWSVSPETQAFMDAEKQRLGVSTNSELLRAKSLDENGRCCGRKPLVYKRPPHQFCCRCDASFDMNGRQIDNWAFKSTDGGFHFVLDHMATRYAAAQKDQPQ